MGKPRVQLLYIVGFHLYKPKNKYQCYQFLSKKNAFSFYESIKNHPNVMNGFIGSDPIDNLSRYDGTLQRREHEFLGDFGYESPTTGA